MVTYVSELNKTYGPLLEKFSTAQSKGELSTLMDDIKKFLLHCILVSI